MPQILGIQRREPFEHSAASSSQYDHPIASDEFTIRKHSNNSIRVFFKRSSAHSQGVGLLLPSTEVAIVLSRALLMVAEGYSTEITSSL